MAAVTKKCYILNISISKIMLFDFFSSDTPVNDFHTRDVVRFPCAKTTKLLIEAGIDVQTMDDDGNTPLHLIVSYHRYGFE